MKKHGFKKVFLGGILTAVLVLTATAAQGSESDPLVTLGYLADQFLPKLLGEVEVKMADRDKELEEKLQAMVDTYSYDMEQKFRKAAVDFGEGATTPGFVTVTVEGGERIWFAAGSEMLFRGGNAICTSPSSPGFVDTTDGSLLEDYQVPRVNHLYLTTDSRRGLVASDTLTILVRGEYVIEGQKTEEPAETDEPAETAEPVENVESAG